MYDDLNRRGFLKTAGLAAATVTVGGISKINAENKPQQKKWQMKLSTSSIHYMELPIEQACEKIAGLGFTGIDIWSAHEGCPHMDDVAKRLGPEGLKELLKKHNLKLFSFSTYSGGYAKYAELLGKAGGGVAVQGSAGPCKPEELTSKMKQFLESLKSLEELAEKYDSYLAIENHGGALVNTLDSFKAFTDLNKSKRIGLALAPYHIQGLKASVPEAIKICGKQLFFFYAWQRQPELLQLPGVGTTDFVPWLQALAEIKYKGYVNPFAHFHPGTDIMSVHLAKSKDYLLQCYKKINDKG